MFADEVRNLISEGKFDYVEKNGDNLLHKSCRCGDKESVITLLKKNFDVNALNNSNETPLYLALMRNHTPIAKLILFQDAEVNFQQCETTPLHLSVQHENCEASEMLMCFGANPDLKDKTGDTPLHVAYEKTNRKLVELLLDSNADYNLTNSQNKTILDLAFLSRKWEMIMHTVLFILVQKKRVHVHIHPRLLRSIDITPGRKVKETVKNFGRVLDQMENTFVLSHISYLSVMTMPHKRLAKLLRNPVAKNDIEYSIMRNRFPPFTTLLICHYKRAYRIYHYQEKLEEGLQDLLPLPIECTRHIIQQFTEKDLIISGDRFDLNDYMRRIMFQDMFLAEYVNLCDSLVRRKSQKRI